MNEYKPKINAIITVLMTIVCITAITVYITVTYKKDRFKRLNKRKPSCIQESITITQEENNDNIINMFSEEGSIEIYYQEEPNVIELQGKNTPYLKRPQSPIVSNEDEYVLPEDIEEVKEIDEVDRLEDIEEIDGLVELEDIDEVKEVEEVEEVNGLVGLEKVEDIEDVKEIEKVKEVEDIDEVEELEEIREPDEVDGLEEIEDIQKVEEVEKIEKVEEIKKVERIQEVMELEKVEKVKDIEKIMELERMIEDIEKTIEEPEEVEIKKLEELEELENVEKVKEIKGILKRQTTKLKDQKETIEELENELRKQVEEEAEKIKALNNQKEQEKSKENIKESIKKLLQKLEEQYRIANKLKVARHKTEEDEEIMKEDHERLKELEEVMLKQTKEEEQAKEEECSIVMDTEAISKENIRLKFGKIGSYQKYIHLINGLNSKLYNKTIFFDKGYTLTIQSDIDIDIDYTLINCLLNIALMNDNLNGITPLEYLTWAERVNWQARILCNVYIWSILDYLNKDPGNWKKLELKGKVNKKINRIKEEFTCILMNILKVNNEIFDKIDITNPSMDMTHLNLEDYVFIDRSRLYNLKIDNYDDCKDAIGFVLVFLDEITEKLDSTCLLSNYARSFKNLLNINGFKGQTKKTITCTVENSDSKVCNCIMDVFNRYNTPYIYVTRMNKIEKMIKVIVENNTQIYLANMILYSLCNDNDSEQLFLEIYNGRNRELNISVSHIYLMLAFTHARNKYIRYNFLVGFFIDFSKPLSNHNINYFNELSNYSASEKEYNDYKYNIRLHFDLACIKEIQNTTIIESSDCKSELKIIIDHRSLNKNMYCVDNRVYYSVNTDIKRSVNVGALHKEIHSLKPYKYTVIYWNILNLSVLTTNIVNIFKIQIDSYNKEASKEQKEGYNLAAFIFINRLAINALNLSKVGFKGDLVEKDKKVSWLKDLEAEYPMMNIKIKNISKFVPKDSTFNVAICIGPVPSK
ncbi:hypothetical protein NEOKW01_1029 [Nematocida sp. AWRm80]|nr:hypothetical protein NEOKW01_1029 [Nematocida sp. AWRm80]